MKNFRKLFSAGMLLSLFWLLSSCDDRKNFKQEGSYEVEKSENQALADSTTARFPQDEAFALNANTNLAKQKNRKFIRTADVRCKVKDIRKASNQVEDLTARFDGFVTFTDLKTFVSRTQQTAISNDSTLETKFYSTENHLTLRVPSEKLDSLIRELNTLVDFLDYRIIKAEDVSLTFVANQKQSKRLEKYEKRVSTAIDNRGKKLDETVNAEETLINRQTQADYTQLQTQELLDQVNFSTVNLQFYQRETIFRETVANFENIRAYRPGLFAKIGEALIEGWYLLEAIIVGLARIWFLIIPLAVVLGFWLSRRKKGN
ncbi:MAG: DUF4349 domain-containing protein [Verrucomicrobia bacterium]|nr:DUF4349 domain-containing protein [Cytophagales bacterium]